MKDNFIEIYNQYITRDGADKLLAWLERSDFFTAPASSRFHGAIEGGLLMHSLNVFKRLSNLLAAEELNATGDMGDSIYEKAAICGLLHDLCKVNFYKPEWKNKKVYCENGSKQDEGGRFDWQVVQGYSIDDQLPYGHGEKSVYIISGFIRLNRDEAMAINWHMGGFDDRVRGGSYALSGAFEKYPLALCLHIADMQATYFDETRDNL